MIHGLKLVGLLDSRRLGLPKYLFPSIGGGFMLSHVWLLLHVFPRLAQVVKTRPLIFLHICCVTFVFCQLIRTL